MMPLNAIRLGLVVATAFTLGFGGIAPVYGAPLVVGPRERVALDAGTHHFDSLTIQAGGVLVLDGGVTLNVDGDFQMLSETQTLTCFDPDTGQSFPCTSIIVGQMVLGVGSAVSDNPPSGVNGTPGLNGVTGFATSAPLRSPRFRPRPVADREGMAATGQHHCCPGLAAHSQCRSRHPDRW